MFLVQALSIHTQFFSVVHITTHCAILEIDFWQCVLTCFQALSTTDGIIPGSSSTQRRKSGNEAILGCVWWLMYVLCKTQRMSTTVKCALASKKGLSGNVYHCKPTLLYGKCKWSYACQRLENSQATLRFTDVLSLLMTIINSISREVGSKFHSETRTYTIE